MLRKRSINLLSSPIPSKVLAQSSFLSSTPIREESQEGTNSKNVSHIDNDKTDWMLCFLCQKPTKEKLQCSALSKEDPKKLYDELGWESLSDRRWGRRKSLYYKIVNGLLLCIF